MIRIGPAGYPRGSTDLVSAIGKVHELGLSALEVQFVRNVYLKDDVASRARAVAEELDVRLSAHAPYYVSLNSQSEETVAKSRDWILKAARAAQAMGAWIIVVHCASYSGMDASAVTKKVSKEIAFCRQVLDMERNNVVIGLETMGKKGQWGTMAEIHQVMDEVAGVQPVVDFAHIHARSGGSIKGKEDFSRVLSEYELRPTKRLHCHFSGIEYTDAGERNHLPLSANSPDYHPLAELLGRSRLDAAFICESTDPTADSVLMGSWLDRSMGGKKNKGEGHQ